MTLGHLNLISHDLFSGRKARFWTICVSKGLDLLKKWPFEGPQRGPNIPNWVSDAYPVKLGQLDHSVEFGTTFGHVEDFQSGKNRPIRVD